MSTREELARAIWRAGTTDPDSLAEYLIREGWAKRGDEFMDGMRTMAISMHQTNASAINPMVNPMTRRDLA